MIAPQARFGGLRVEPHLASSSLSLNRHQKLVTDSPDEVYALMSRLYSEARMFLRRPRDRFQSRVHAASLGQVGLLYNANTPGYGVNLVMPERFFFLSLAIHGQMRHRLRTADEISPVPNRPHWIRCSGGCGS